MYWYWQGQSDAYLFQGQCVKMLHICVKVNYVRYCVDCVKWLMFAYLFTVLSFMKITVKKDNTFVCHMFLYMKC